MSHAYELWYVCSGIILTLVKFAVEHISRQQQPRICDLKDANVLSSLLGGKVLRIEDWDEVCIGAGGTGTIRAAFCAYMQDGSVLNLFTKCPTESLFERVFLTLFRVYDNEFNFYANIRHTLPDVNFARSNDSNSNNSDSNDNISLWCPRVYYAKQFGSGKFLLLLEDVRKRPGGCSFQDNMAVFTQDRARSVLKLQSKMHAYFWNSPPEGVWAYSPTTGKPLGHTPPFLTMIAEHAMKTVKKKYSHLITIHEDVLTAYDLFVRHFDVIRAFWSTGPLTLVHGDAHMANTFYQNNTDTAGLVDMQCVAAEHGMRDVSYHLINSCPEQDLGDMEAELIRYYLSQLTICLQEYHRDEGYVTPSYEHAYFLYRSHALWTVVAWVISCGTSDLVETEAGTKSLNRVFATCHRLNTLEATKQIIAGNASQKI